MAGEHLCGHTWPQGRAGSRCGCVARRMLALVGSVISGAFPRVRVIQGSPDEAALEARNAMLVSDSAIPFHSIPCRALTYPFTWKESFFYWVERRDGNNARSPLVLISTKTWGRKGDCLRRDLHGGRVASCVTFMGWRRHSRAVTTAQQPLIHPGPPSIEQGERVGVDSHCPFMGLHAHLRG